MTIPRSAFPTNRPAPNRAKMKRIAATILVVISSLAIPTLLPGTAFANHFNGTFVSLRPDRILDTRVNQGAFGPVPALGEISVQVLGLGGIPTTDVKAVTLNVTVVSPAASGFITAWPTGTPRPTVSNLNFQAGKNIPNLVVVPVGIGGTIQLFNGSSGTVQLIADVAGYTQNQAGFANDPVVSPGAFASLPPERILDTRLNFGAFGPVPAQGQIPLQVTGRGGVPAFGVEAVTLNVTAVSPSSNGYITVWPSGLRPNASNLNFQTGQNIPNLVVVPVSASGTIQLFNGSFGTVHLLADVAGYTLSGVPTLPGTFQSLAPSRIVDTRLNQGAVGPVGQLGTIEVQVAGQGGIPLVGAAAVVLNVTAVSPSSSGYITVWPSGAPFPNASNLNYQAGQDIPNLVVVPVGTAGKILMFNGSFGNVHLLADVAGYYLL